jgi:ribosomal protein S18 acetylase RimI-like enzyme
MNKIEYKNLVFNETSILKLYNDNGWSNYTKDEKSLFKGIKNSLFSFAAYDGETLVGLIRVVGDGYTIIYIQDILVLNQYQRQGIGTNLIHKVLNKYNKVRQICLTTDLTEKQKKFYEKCGFTQYDNKDLAGFIYNK